MFLARARPAEGQPTEAFGHPLFVVSAKLTSRAGRRGETCCLRPSSLSGFTEGYAETSEATPGQMAGD